MTQEAKDQIIALFRKHGILADNSTQFIVKFDDGREVDIVAIAQEAAEIYIKERKVVIDHPQGDSLGGAKNIITDET